jgi:hypothetical protein
MVKKLLMSFSTCNDDCTNFTSPMICRAAAHGCGRRRRRRRPRPQRQPVPPLAGLSVFLTLIQSREGPDSRPDRLGGCRVESLVAVMAAAREHAHQRACPTHDQLSAPSHPTRPAPAAAYHANVAGGLRRIYVDFVNWGLMALTLGLTLTFRSSHNLAAAFGIAASLTMLLTMISFSTMREVWGWSRRIIEHETRGARALTYPTTKSWHTSVHSPFAPAPLPRAALPRGPDGAGGST